MSVVERERVEVEWKVTEADVLTRAADLLEEFGWCQGSLTNLGNSKSICDARVDRFCLSGAIGRAAYDLHGEGLRGDAAWTAAWIRVGGSKSIGWNDDRARTKAEVVTALREAAAKARA